ncbi:MAG: lactate utilization protein [Desulfurococcales archaeon]|nr:lactate utilization protein [Desulfurococcales archaeon]
MMLEKVLEDIYKGLEDPEFSMAISRSVSNAEGKHLRVKESYPYVEDLRLRVLEAKKKALENIDYYIDQLARSLERNHGVLHIARDRDEAQSILGDLVGSGKLVVFSKSIVAEELGLREYLESLGNQVWETDLGQLLIQLEHGKPMHTTAPAIHLTIEKAARLVREKLGGELPSSPEPEDIVSAVRRFLRGIYYRADVGISGANAVAADTGSIVLVENEGNIRLVTGYPPIHIAVTGIEKIVPSLNDAISYALVQAAYAGLFPPTYLNVISGPSNTADIEHRRVYGAHGPRELHLILIDNGRRRALLDPGLRDHLRCIRCGRCQWECPVWHHTANKWGGPTYGGPMGVLWTAITLGKETGAELSMLCLGCARCDEVCPMEIPLSSLIRGLKSVYSSKI